MLNKIKLTLPAARKNANMTQKDLASALGVSTTTVANWERGRTEPTISQAREIGVIVGLSIDDIIFRRSDTV